MNSKFTLKQVTHTKFRILCGADTVGSILLEANEVNDLLRQWSGLTDCLPKPRQSHKQKSNPVVDAIMKAKANAVSSCLARLF